MSNKKVFHKYFTVNIILFCELPQAGQGGLKKRTLRLHPRPEAGAKYAAGGADGLGGVGRTRGTCQTGKTGWTEWTNGRDGQNRRSGWFDRLTTGRTRGIKEANLAFAPPARGRG